MARAQVLELDGLEMGAVTPGASGAHALAELCRLCKTGLARVRSTLAEEGCSGLAVIGRVRGTGPGVSFSEAVRAIERDLPLELRSPFEGSTSIAGAAWPPPEEATGPESRLTKLRWEPGTNDLPLHAHEHADRFIIVLEGRGYFHVSPEPLDQFRGMVRSVPVRSRDALIFTRGVLHTFSTDASQMLLLSFHAPFIPFSDPRQFTVVTPEWTPARIRGAGRARIGCDPAWSVLLWAAVTEPSQPTPTP